MLHIEIHKIREKWKPKKKKKKEIKLQIYLRTYLTYFLLNVRAIAATICIDLPRLDEKKEE